MTVKVTEFQERHGSEPATLFIMARDFYWDAQKPPHLLPPYYLFPDGNSPPVMGYTKAACPRTLVVPR